jgi:hypothetical protein
VEYAAMDCVVPLLIVKMVLDVAGAGFFRFLKKGVGKMIHHFKKQSNLGGISFSMTLLIPEL